MAVRAPGEVQPRARARARAVDAVVASHLVDVSDLGQTRTAQDPVHHHDHQLGSLRVGAVTVSEAGRQTRTLPDPDHGPLRRDVAAELETMVRMPDPGV